MVSLAQENSPQKLKVALIVDGECVDHYVHALALWGQQQPQLEITHLVVQQLAPQVPTHNILKAIASFRKNGLRRVLQQVGFVFIHTIEARKLSYHASYKHHHRRASLVDVVKQRVFVTPILSQSGFVYRYSEADVKQIKDLNFDVLIRCGSGILRGEILHAARFGILSFHHADNTINRGGPPGFWEVFLRQPVSGFTIQQLTPELDGGNVLFRGWLTTKFYYLLNQAALYNKSNYYLKKVLTEIAHTRQLPKMQKSYPYYNPLYKQPGIGVQLRYLVRLAGMAIGKLCNALLFKKQLRWSVAFCKMPWRRLVMWRAIRIPNPPHRFLADPFVVEHSGAHYCFVEDYDYRTARACISAYQLHDTHATALGVALDEPFHLSFPYVFKYQSTYYMCPESHENRDIRLYECEQFPLRWKLKKIIMQDVSAADTMIFEKDGTWWLFTNIDSVGGGDHHTELCIFYADHPLCDDWTPHPQNPIMVDALRARNGGILSDEEGLYRVSQRPGFDVYGQSSTINRMYVSKTDYTETRLTHIEPNFFKRLIGTHHLHSNGSFTVFDCVERQKTI